MTDTAESSSERARRLHALAPFLRELIAHRARGLIRYESVEDLAQGVQLRALRARDMPSEESASRAWLAVIARRHIADRADYYRALRRDSASALRITREGSMNEGAVPIPAAPGPGPRTFAERREMLTVAVRALAALPPRDQDFVRWSSEGVDLEEQARRAELSYAAAQRAALRARDRFRKTFQLMLRAPGGGAEESS